MDFAHQLDWLLTGPLFLSLDAHWVNFQAQEKLGPVDVLVNCAGTSLAGKFEDLEVSAFEVSKNLFIFSLW